MALHARKQLLRNQSSHNTNGNSSAKQTFLRSKMKNPNAKKPLRRVSLNNIA